MADPRAYLADPEDAATSTVPAPATAWPELVEYTSVTVTAPLVELVGAHRYEDPRSAMAEFVTVVGNVTAFLTRAQAIRLRDELTARLAEVGE